MNRVERILALVLLLSSLALYVRTPSLVERPLLNLIGMDHPWLDPLVFPRAVVGLLVIGCFLYFIQAFRSKGSGAATEKLDKGEVVSFFVTLGLLVGYLLAMTWLGFWVATPLFMISVGLCWGSRKLVPMLLTSGLTTLLVYVVFAHFLKILFPTAGFLH